MLRTGEADWAYAISADDTKNVPKYAASTVAETAGVRMDTANPVLKDQRVRMAMNLAVDRQSIVDKLFAGFGEPAKGQMIGEYVLGFNPDLKPYPYDVAQAKKLVQDAKTAGVPTDTTELEMWVSNGRLPRWNELAESLSNSFNGVGLKTKLRLLEHSAWVSGFASVKPGERPGPLFQWPHGNDLGDSSQTIDGYVRTGGSRSTHSDPALDAIVDKATVAVGDERVKLYQQAWKKVYDDALVVPLYRIKGITGLSKRLNFSPRMDDWAPVQEMSLVE